VAEVLWVDRFGNVQLNVGPEDIEALGDPIVVRTRDPLGRESARTATRAEAFSGLGAGQLGAVVDSYGLIALCLDRASAAGDLGLAAGDIVRLAEAAEGEGQGITTPVELRIRPGAR